MITNRPLPPPSPTPLCATYAQHLPLLRAHELTPGQAEVLHDHLAACAWCQSVLATYDVVDDALRRHFGPGHVAARAVTMEGIMRATDQEDRRSPSDGDSDDVLVATDLRTFPPRRRLLQPRRLLSGLAAVAAVLLVALLAEMLFALHLHQPPVGRHPVISLRAVRTGQFTEYPLPVPTRIYTPSSIVAGRDGALWFTETNAGAIGRLSPNGAFAEFPLPQTDSTPNGLTLGPDGNLWFTEWYGGKIGRITPAGTITEFAVPSAAKSSSGLTAIASGPDGNLWFTEQQRGQIGRITPQGRVTEFRIAISGSGPAAITAGPDGNLWFADQDRNQIGRITPQGHITEFPLPEAASSPDGITAGSDGSMWFTEADGNRIGRITLQGRVTEFLVSQAGSMSTGSLRSTMYPRRVEFGQGRITNGQDGKLWFVEASGNAIGCITTQGLLTEFPLPTSNSGLDSITAGPEGGLWFTENISDRIGLFSP